MNKVSYTKLIEIVMCEFPETAALGTCKLGMEDLINKPKATKVNFSDFFKSRIHNSNI